jgi:hypothetical protein
VQLSLLRGFQQVCERRVVYSTLTRREGRERVRHSRDDTEETIWKSRCTPDPSHGGVEFRRLNLGAKESNIQSDHATEPRRCLYEVSNASTQRYEGDYGSQTLVTDDERLAMTRLFLSRRNRAATK